MSYKDKYLKYKNKYLTLKKQLGGDTGGATGGAGGDTGGATGGAGECEELKAYLLTLGGYGDGPGDCEWSTFLIIACSKERAFQLYEEDDNEWNFTDAPTIENIVELTDVIVKNDVKEYIASYF